MTEQRLSVVAPFLSRNINLNHKHMRKTYRTNYSVATEWLHNSLVLCNSISEIDTSVWDNMMPVYNLEYDEDAEIEEDSEDENEEYLDTSDEEIYQWYLTDCSQWDVNFLRENFGLWFTYSDMLDLYVLCVNHYGCAWEYVEWTTLCETAEATIGQTRDKI